MSDIREFPTAETQGSTNRKPGRPKVEDPKVSVTLTIHRSTWNCINAQLRGQSVAAALSAAVEAKYGVRATHIEVSPRPKHAS